MKNSSSSNDFPERLLEIAEAKSEAWLRWENGDTTTLEFRHELETLHTRELRAHVANADMQKRGSLLRKPIIVVTAVFLLGTVFGRFVYPHIFGYQNAEECAIANSSRYAVAACYELYPRVNR